MTFVEDFDLDYGVDDILWDIVAIDDGDAGTAKDDGFIAVGESYTDGTYLKQAIIIRVKADLSDYDWIVPVGGLGNDVAYAVEQRANDNGNILVVGKRYSQIYSFGPSDNLWFAEYDTDGDLVGERLYGGSGNEEGFDIKEDVNTDPIQYVITGGTGRYQDGDFDYFDDPGEPEISNSGEYWLFTIYPTGHANEYDIIWQNIYDGGNNIGPTRDWSHSIVIDDDGDYVIAGLGRSCSTATGQMQAMLVKVENDGTLDWKEDFGDETTDGNDRDQMAYNVIQTNISTNAYLASGISHPALDVCATENHDTYTLRVSNTGSNIWSANCTELAEGKGFGGLSNEDGFGAVLTCGGKYLIAGTAHSPSGDGDVTCNHDINGPNYTSDAWLLCLNSSGVKQWDFSIGGSKNDAAYSIIKSPDGSYLIAGEKGVGSEADFFIYQFTLDECSKKQQGHEGTKSEFLHAYPNPSDDIVNISFQCPATFTQSATITIINSLGTVVYCLKTKIENGVLEKKLVVHNFPAGLYSIRIVSSDKSYESKIAIERSY